MASDSGADKVKGQLPNIGEKLEVLGEVLKEFVADSFPYIDVALKIMGVVLRDLGIGWEFADILSSGDGAGPSGSGSGAGGAPNPFEAIPQRLGALETALTELRGKLDGVVAETNAIEAKNDTLGDLLGKTLVGKGWVVDPRTTVTEPNKLPPIAIKDEMHGIEAALDALQRLLNGQPIDPGLGTPPAGVAANPNPGARPGGGATPRPWPPSGPFISEDEDPPIVVVPTPPPPVPRLDPRLKRIYVYEQGVFTATGDSDARTVTVRTAAFDLSGWVDLTELRPGDIVVVEVLVAVAGRPYRLFRETAFVTAGLKAFADFCGGLNYISGDDIRIILRQPHSADDFATPVDVPYQFVVESRDAPN